MNILKIIFCVLCAFSSAFWLSFGLEISVRQSFALIGAFAFLIMIRDIFKK